MAQGPGYTYVCGSASGDAPNAGTALSIETLSDVPLFAGRPPRQIPPKRKAAAWIASGIIQLVLFSAFLFSSQLTEFVRHGSPRELTLELRGATRSDRPDV